MTYPTLQPITKANLEAAIADAVARKHGISVERPTSRIANVRLKSVVKTAIVERMTDQMLNHGEGMTEGDLIRLGWSPEIVEICGPLANAAALHRAGLN